MRLIINENNALKKPAMIDFISLKSSFYSCEMNEKCLGVSETNDILYKIDYNEFESIAKKKDNFEIFLCLKQNECNLEILCYRQFLSCDQHHSCNVDQALNCKGEIENCWEINNRDGFDEFKFLVNCKRRFCQGILKHFNSF